MQDEVNEKCIAVSVRAAKMTEEVLRKAVLQALAAMEDRKEGKPTGTYKGQINIKELAAGKDEISNIRITDDNIRSFEKVARKYGVTYSLKKDKSQSPPQYLVFFKMKQVVQLEASFKEYTASTMKKQEKPSVRQKLQQKIKEVAQRLPVQPVIPAPQKVR